MKIALVHDYLVQYGGGERVFEVFTKMFPQASLYTLIYDPVNLYGAFKGKHIETSFIQNFPFAKKNHRIFPPLMPLGIEDLDLRGYDLVISSSSSYAKGILTGSNTLHICYCHTPMRYVWDDCHRYFQEFQYNRVVKMLLPFMITYLRMWDKVSADRVDRYIANSQNVARRIQKYYNLPAQVIYPPVDIHRFKVLDNPTADYYLMLGRFLPYKHYDIVVQACKETGKKLKIVGSGPEESHLKSLAGESPNIEFLGRLSDEEAQEVFMNCKSFIFPSEDDFGIVPVEAMAAGRPVIAFGKGGARETVIEGKTGIFFEHQTKESVKQAIERFESMTFDSQYIRAHAEYFDTQRFIKEMNMFIQEQLSIQQTS